MNIKEFFFKFLSWFSCCTQNLYNITHINSKWKKKKKSGQTARKSSGIKSVPTVYRSNSFLDNRPQFGKVFSTINEEIRREESIYILKQPSRQGSSSNFNLTRHGSLSNLSGLTRYDSSSSVNK
ncbi:hypothetical protein BMR1_02g00721 [Babesia microti strain RI]|uniref:Uncharacterized protein n=1 Tax=Babesia microti (strain RI) TaxID=1133968 RepID=A0A1R4AA27_BABMR|nr:hypothetical protein BMR1_02g00721 [Babesia microti strain RI]SJK85834.1 hypothetical protein BMR1_02g00721 [Babesia microti strain RI]|eukprot:XP_021338050.1 hypothetical protein BMR1_02g00721 [Babesia microti strain RI]